MGAQQSGAFAESDDDDPAQDHARTEKLHRQRDLTEEERPREKFAASPSQASMVDLVAILLRTGRKGRLRPFEC